MFVEKANCQACGKEFNKRHYRHRFCQRRCFLAYRYKSTLANHHAGYCCGNCGAKVTLGFDPKKQPAIWSHFRCPICHLTPIQTLNLHTTVVSELKFRYTKYDITCES